MLSEQTVSRRWQFALEVMVLAAALALFVAIDVVPAQRAQGYDLAPVAVAGRLAAIGHLERLYAHDPRHYNRTNDPVFDQAARDIGFRFGSTPFVYPPLVAVAARPLAAVPFPTVMAAWTWLSMLFVLATVWLGLHLYAPRWNRPAILAAILASFVIFEPVRYGFWLGQTTSIIFLLILGALALARRGHPVAAGLLLAPAAFVKLTPVVFAALWLWRGPRRAFLWFAGAFTALWTLSLALCGPHLHLEYIARLRQIAATTLTAYNNHSLPACFARPGTPPGELTLWLYQTPPLPAKLAALAIIGAATAYAAWRLTRTFDRNAAEGFAFLLILLAPSIAWTHYFVFALPVMAILVMRDRLAGGAATLLAFALLTRPVIGNHARFDPRADHLLAAPTIAALVLLAALLYTLRPPRTPTPPSAHAEGGSP